MCWRKKNSNNIVVRTSTNKSIDTTSHGIQTSRQDVSQSRWFFGTLRTRCGIRFPCRRNVLRLWLHHNVPQCTQVATFFYYSERHLFLHRRCSDYCCVIYAPFRKIKIINQRLLCELLCYPLATSNARKHLVSRFSLPTTDCCLAHPTPSQTPSWTSLNFAGCSFLWRVVAVRKQVSEWRANFQLVGGCFLSRPNPNK